ncbi:MAG: hypothetical protein AB1938_25600 [Myxococcota bacterium]
MPSQSPEAVGARLEQSLQTFALGLELIRERLRREHPRASRAWRDEQVRQWLRGEPHGGEGLHAVDFFRRPSRGRSRARWKISPRAMPAQRLSVDRQLALEPLPESPATWTSPSRSKRTLKPKRSSGR